MPNEKEELRREPVFTGNVKKLPKPSEESRPSTIRSKYSKPKRTE